ncbi:MAG: hypothetical protein M1839_003711 [Geoglossum umbratile]|nr:MAG: hypothetical protein M1839_003711 [Geoglossum umbratile]
MRPIYSEGESSGELQGIVGALLVDGGGRWTLSKNRKGLEREVGFKTFKKAWEFMNIVASESARQRHHPEWANVYNKTFIRWTTHSPSGLSLKDASMARFCDEQARAMGELNEASSENKTDNSGSSLVDRVVGGCCSSK